MIIFLLSILMVDETRLSGIPFLSEPPRLEDFRAMRPEGAVAKQMMRVDGFRQNYPESDAPATLPADVFMGYDRDRLYIVFLAFDEPERIRANMAAREDIDNDDHVTVLLDTHADQRRAYAFAANPLGVQWDARYTEGQGFDTAFQAVWDSRGIVTAGGYVVRFAIPFKSLRFPREDEGRAWGLMFRRHVPHLNEQAWWPANSESIEGTLKESGRLEGLDRIAGGQNFQVVPYGFARGFETLDQSRTSEERAGIDAKAVLGGNLVLDLTFEPDFSQVEADAPQITVNQRFEVFFPERRAFFLENTDFFQTPINLVFTRRIADPRAGIRLSGKQGRYGLGALLIDDEAPGLGLPETDPAAGERAAVGVLRLTRDLGAHSQLGLLHTHHRFDGVTNRVTGLDGRFRLDEHWVIDAQAAASRESAADGALFWARLGYTGLHWYHRTSVHQTDPEFGTALGFLGGSFRPDSRSISNYTAYTFRPNGRILSWGTALWAVARDTTGGARLDRVVKPELWINFAGNHALDFEWEIEEERLLPGLDPVQEAMSFDNRRYSIGADIELSKRATLFLDADWGRRINFVARAGGPVSADFLFARAGLRYRPITPLRIDLSYLSDTMDDREISGTVFENEILQTRVNWQLTRALSTRLIYRRDLLDPDPALSRLERERNHNLDLLIRYVVNPWTAAYLGYNTNRANLSVNEDGMSIRTPTGLEVTGEQLFLKISYRYGF